MVKLELWSVTSFRFQALVLKICTTKVADRVLGRSQKRQIVWTVLCVALWCSHRGHALLLLVVSWASSTHPDFESQASRWCLCSRAAAWIHFRESGSIPELQEIIFTLSTLHRSFFLVTGKIIQPDVTLSTSVVAFVVIVDKDFKPLRLLWGRPGSDRL